MNALLALALLSSSADPTALGAIKAGAPLTHAFTISNINANPMAITGFTASCGCTSHTFEKTTLKAGETTTLAVKINTLAHAAGPWSWSAAVTTQVEGGAKATVPLRLTGTLVREITVTPLALAISTEGPAAERPITIAWPVNRRFAIDATKTRMSSPHLQGLGFETDHLPTARLTIRVSESLPFGDHTESVTLVTNDAEYPEIIIPVTIRKRKPAAATVTPEQVDLSDATPSVLVQVRATAGTSVRIADCKSDADAVTMTWSKESGTAATVRVKLAGTAAKSGMATVTVSLAEPAGAALTLPVTWRRD